MSERFDFTGDELAPAYRAAVDAIEAGDLVVMPTDTVYGLAADAFKSDAVQRLMDAKGRGRDMPPPVLISVVESLDALATDVPDNGRKLAEEFWPGPLTLICHAQTSLMWDLGETQGTVALRVPDHENTRELLSRTGPLAVSSANRSGKPAALDVYDAEEQLGESVAVYLDGGEATVGQPSTIVDITGEIPRVLREGAVTLDELRKVVPEVTTDTEPPAPTAAEPKADEPKDDEPKTAQEAAETALPAATAVAAATDTPHTADHPTTDTDGSTATEPNADEKAREAAEAATSGAASAGDPQVDEPKATEVDSGTPAPQPAEQAEADATESAANQPKADEPKADEPQAVEQPKPDVSEPATDEPKVDEPKADSGEAEGGDSRTVGVVEASKGDEKKTDSDVRPAD
ncbi:L-threonylcarbamoyladenylate synthase [Kribbella sp. HUAS MG21]|uniref:L-threonylcarbamoyladenylate synthase n=1 Tax=Kribbella sp. HUAS MG21 TaxID=3160966 RepID=A0AAU7T464_9ACTN